MAHDHLQLFSSSNSWSARMAESILRAYPLVNAEWHYEHGLMVKAIAEVGAATSNERFLQFVDAWVDHFVTPGGKIRTYRLDDYNLDQINPGNLLFAPYFRTGEKRYRQAIELLRRQLKEQPRNGSGGFWHKKIYPDQMWLDGIYMAAPFLARFATAFDEMEILDDITRQILLIERHTRDPQTGLLYHAWDEKRVQKWADPQTGCSPNFWGRGIGWFVMALVDILEILPEGYSQTGSLCTILEQLSQALLRVQDANTGLWHQVLDKPNQDGNYLESSVSAMLSFAFAKSVRLGFLSPEYLIAARRAYHGLLENRIKVDASGLLTLEGTCGSAGVGGQPYRDGSFSYYVNEKIVTNDFKGVGPFIMAALEMESAGVKLQHVD